MTIDELRSIADSKLPGLKDDVGRSRDQFRNLHLGAGTFSDFPEAQVVARRHEGAHAVYVDTISGVIADLEDLEHRLRASVASAEATDEEVEASLVALGNRLSQRHAFASDTSYRDSNHAHNADLSAGRQDGAQTPATPFADDTPANPPTTGESF
ncbi:MAG: hypothetical protein ACRDOY_13835 [Nocardioidaceae bacterium]